MNWTQKIEQAEKVLNYWVKVDFLTQDEVPNGKNNIVIQLDDDQDLHTLIVDKINKENTLTRISKSRSKSETIDFGNITIYLGRIRREACIEKIAALMGKNIESCSVKLSYDYISLATLQLSPNGQYLDDSFALSPVIWAMNNMEKADFDNIDIAEYNSSVSKLFDSQLKQLLSKHNHISSTASEDADKTHKFSNDAATIEG